MFRVDTLLQILVILTVGVSGLLLGMAQSDMNPFVIAVAGALAANVLCDRLRWFYLPQWVANSIAILVTLFTVLSFFFAGDSVRQLIGVGKLLVYLQTILLFQQKSARVYWQVLVLSLLQVVVSAVFNLGFEGGVLFIVYMVAAGATMMVLNLYQDSRSVRDKNRFLFSQLNAANSSGQFVRQPIAIFDATNSKQGILNKMFRSFGTLGVGSLGFAICLFYFLPREHNSWSGPRETAMKMTGFSKAVELDHSDMILLSSRLEMTVTYRNPLTLEPVELRQEPYLRGLALSHLVIKDNRTTWQAPYGRVYPTDYRAIPQLNTGTYHLIQDIVLEPTEDPLLYSASPAKRGDDIATEDIDYCPPLAAITRQKSADTIQLAHYRYSLRIPTHPDGSFLNSVPYTVQSDTRRPLTPEAEPGRYKSFIHMDPERYPTLVDTSASLATNVPLAGNHLQIAKSMEQYLLDESRFQYTLDYRGVPRDDSIDAVEDFFANHRQGHCEYYASALTLMLRSQGIPARVVVGFRGGNVNEFGDHIDVEARYAHAWVEAYIRPADCTPEMVQDGEAGPLGAWLTLDPTPSQNLNDGLLSGAEDALGLAKSLWRDYVLGLQSNRSMNSVNKNNVQFSGLLSLLDLDWWQDSFSSIREGIQDPSSRWWHLRIAIPFVLVGLFAILGWKWRHRFGKSKRTRNTPRMSVRNRIASLIKPFSPTLGRLIEESQQKSRQEIDFYQRLIHMLEKAGLVRGDSQTQREFAHHCSIELQAKSDQTEPGNLTILITEFYYLVRFGNQALNDRQRSEVENALNRLDSFLTSESGNSV